MVRTPQPLLLSAALALLTAAALPAQTKLHLKVFTSGGRGFSVNSTLVYGNKDAVLIDAQFITSEAQKLAAEIRASGKNLTTIYITHPHPDHYFGLAVLKQAFPNAKIVALPVTVQGIQKGWEARAKFWSSEYAGELPTTGPILPEPLTGDTLTLEGQTLKIVGPVTGDTPGNNSYVWIPSIRTVIAGDTVFSGVHFSVPKTNDDWFKTLDAIAALKPARIVPGHQIPGAKEDVSALRFMKNYMRDYDQALSSSHSAAELEATMNSKYPNMGLERLLVSAAEGAFPAKKN